MPHFVGFVAVANCVGGRGEGGKPGRRTAGWAPTFHHLLTMAPLRHSALQVFSCTPDELLPAVRAELEGLLNVRACLPHACDAAMLPCVTAAARWLALTLAACVRCRLHAGAAVPQTSAEQGPPAARLAALQVGQTLLEGYIRPGCTQLTLNALMPQKRVAEVKVCVLIVSLARPWRLLRWPCPPGEICSATVLYCNSGREGATGSYSATVLHCHIAAVLYYYSAPALPCSATLLHCYSAALLHLLPPCEGVAASAVHPCQLRSQWAPWPLVTMWHLMSSARPGSAARHPVQAGGLGSLVTELLATCDSSDVLQQDMLVQVSPAPVGGCLAA